MRIKLFATTLLLSMAATPTLAQPVNPYNTDWLVYTVTQACQILWNGMSQCFPVALIGPAASNPYLIHTPYANRPSVAFTPPSPPPAPTPQAPVAEPEPLPETPAMPQVAVSEPAPAPVEPPQVHFAFDSAKLAAAEQEALDRWLSQLGEGQSIRLAGHADRFGPSAYNQTLSRRRAEAVRRYLTSKGMRPNDLEVVAKGEKEPIVTCKGRATPDIKDCLGPNRRVEIHLR